MQESQETQVQSLAQEDPLEKEMATHPSILVWKIQWTEEPGGLQFYGVTKSQTWLSNCAHTHNTKYKCKWIEGPHLEQQGQMSCRELIFYNILIQNN